MDRIQQSPDSGLYQIRVRSVLNARWVAWFDDFTITPVNQNETLLTGWVTDQASLHGVLGKIRDLGLDLLLVKRVEGKDE
ncbi:MAG: hypothetical protein AB1894_09715 [Chloroflexota bacterium]